MQFQSAILCNLEPVMTPFYVSRNELRTSRAESGRYHLYRVFAFRKRPQLFTKCGALEHSFDLDPVQFEARIA